MAETLNSVQTGTPKAASKGGLVTYSTPDRGDGLAGVVKAKSKAEAKKEFDKMREKHAPKKSTKADK